MLKKLFSYTYIASGTTTTCFTGRGMLHAITVNGTAAGAISVIDGTGVVANIATLKASIAEGTYFFDCSVNSGLKIITAAASDITVLWQQ
jgi:hypothetical protein